MKSRRYPAAFFIAGSWKGLIVRLTASQNVTPSGFVPTLFPLSTVMPTLRGFPAGAAHRQEGEFGVRPFLPVYSASGTKTSHKKKPQGTCGFCLLSIVYCLLLLSIVYCLLSIAYCLLPTAYFTTTP